MYDTTIARPLSQGRAVACLALTAVLWSTSGLFIKLLAWSPLAILSGRSAIAGLVVLLYLGRVDLRFSRWQIIGAVCYVATQFAFISATKLTTAANAIFLQYAAPLYVLLFGWWLLRERPTKADYAAMIAIFAGMLLFLGENLSLQGLRGNLLAIFSGITLAGMTMAARAEAGGTPGKTFLLGSLAGVVLGLPWLLRADFTPASAGMVAYLGVFQMGLAMVFYSIGIRRVPALEASLILTIEPVLNPVWVFLVIGEVPGPLSILGAALVVGAVTARGLWGARRTN